MKGLVLASGFGGSAQQPLLRALSEVLRSQFPRQRRVGFGNVRPSPNYTRELKRLRSARARLGCDEVVLIGRSFGGRMCTFFAVEDPPAALVVLGHPIRPPGKRREDDEVNLKELTCPTLIVQGDQDALGPLRILRPLVRTNPLVELKVLRGAGHSYTRKQEQELLDITERWLKALK